MPDVIQLTLAGGDKLVIRRIQVIAAHKAAHGESHSGGRTKIYLANGETLFVRESPEHAVLPP